MIRDVSLYQAQVLLNQFSEWLDTFPATDDQSHDDLVKIFLGQRSLAALPHLAEGKH